MMSSITGTGCQLSALTAAFVTARAESWQPVPVMLLIIALPLRMQ